MHHWFLLNHCLSPQLCLGFCLFPVIHWNWGSAIQGNKTPTAINPSQKHLNCFDWLILYEDILEIRCHLCMSLTLCWIKFCLLQDLNYFHTLFTLERFLSSVLLPSESCWKSFSELLLHYCSFIPTFWSLMNNKFSGVAFKGESFLRGTKNIYSLFKF